MPVSRAGSVEPDQAVRVFEEVCLKTAPSFSGAVQAARKAGVTNFTDGFMTIGTTRDRRMSVQIKENSECAVTTPPQKSRFLSTQFVRTINRYAELRRLPSSARIKDVPFIFQHDRTGGEAFVMLKDDD